MAQAPVPSKADFLLRIAKPEAFASISDSAIDTALSDEADACAAYYGNRATLPLTEVDGGFTRAVCARAGLSLMAYRGFNRQAGADKEIVEASARATAWLEQVRDGSLNPYFVDSSESVQEDAPLFGTSEKSDFWITREPRET